MPSDRHQRFLQIDTIILDVCGQACPKYPEKQVCYLQYLEKEVNDEADFLHADKHESCLQTDTMIFNGDVQAFPKWPK